VLDPSYSSATLDGSVRFYFEGEATPEVLADHGLARTSKKTNGAGKSDEEACRWAALSAFKALEAKAKQLGANAVIGIRSNYGKRGLDQRDAVRMPCRRLDVRRRLHRPLREDRRALMATGPRIEVRLARLPPLLAEATAAGEDWMSRQERERLAAMRSARRRDEFLAGTGSRAGSRPTASAARRPPTCSRTKPAARPGCARCAMTPASMPRSATPANGSRPRSPPSRLASTWRRRASRATCWRSRPGHFRPAELEALHALRDRERPGAFYRLWTAREAVGKREGHGLRLEVSRVQCMQACAADVAELLCWSFEGLSLSLAGPPGLQAQPDGIPDGACATGYRIVAAA
jgi:hypothetical protein